MTKEIDDLVVMTLTMNPPSGRKRRIYAGVGLSCRRVGKGTYRVQWEKGILLPGVGAHRFGSFPILVQVLSPWMGMALVSFSDDAASAVVTIYEIPRLSRARLASRNLERVLDWQSKHMALSDRAGFCLMTYRRGGEKSRGR